MNFSPSLGETLIIESPSDTESVAVTFSYSAIPPENAIPEVWTNFPDGNWNAFALSPVENQPNLQTGSIKSSKSSELDQFEFTYRMKYFDGGIDWLGNSAGNGKIQTKRIEPKTENLVEPANSAAVVSGESAELTAASQPDTEMTFATSESQDNVENPSALPASENHQEISSPTENQGTEKTETSPKTEANENTPALPETKRTLTRQRSLNSLATPASFPNAPTSKSRLANLLIYFAPRLAANSSESTPKPATELRLLGKQFVRNPIKTVWNEMTAMIGFTVAILLWTLGKKNFHSNQKPKNLQSNGNSAEIAK